MPIPAVALEMMPSPTPGKLVRGYKDSAHHTLKNYRQNPLNYSVPLSNGLRAGTPGQRTSVSGQHGSLDASGFHLVPKIGGGSYGSLARGLAQGMNASARTREIRDTLML